MRSSLLIAVIFLTFQHGAFGKTYTVSPGMFIQEVLDKAEEGDTVQILPGDYCETITINTPGITVKGFEYEGAYTVFNGRNMGGGFLENAIFVNASNVTLQDLKILSFENVAIQVSSVENISISGVDISQVRNIAIALTDVSKSILNECQIRDAEQTGVILRDCREITIQESEIYRNSIAVDIKDSVTVAIKEVAFYHNQSGVVMEGENTDEEIRSSHIKISHCRFIGNGGGAKATKESFGLGIFINGYDHVEVSHSYFESNSTYGILVQSNSTNGRTFLTNHVYVHHNHYSNNGGAPNSEFLKPFSEADGGDILFDGKGERNQFQEKTELKTWPKELVQELGGVHTEMIHFI